MRASRLFLSLLSIPLLSAPTLAAPPAPRVKPEPPHFSDILTERDFRRFTEGLRAADAGAWTRVDALARSINDPVAADILLWRRLTTHVGASFRALDAGLDTFADWPGEAVIRREAEAKIGAARLSPRAVDAWFQEHPARTGPGLIAHAEALFALDRDEEGLETLRLAWRERLMPRSLQRSTFRKHRSRFTQDDHAERVDYLLWRGQRSAASGLLSQLPTGQRRVAEARIKLAARAHGVDAAVARVPAALQSDPGLLYERARWRRKARRTDAALPLLLDIPGAALDGAGAGAVWRERRVHITRALADGEATTAYRLASEHGLESGVNFADAEWLSGWLALRHLDDPDQAEAHFSRLADGVSTPISSARAAYWRGRAAETRGDVPAAKAFFQDAAAHPTAFYGQLASTRLAAPAAPTMLPPDAAPTDEQRAVFRAQPLAKAMQLLSEVDQPRLFDRFAFALDDTLSEPWEFALLAELAADYGRKKVGVRGGKAGIARGVVEPSAAYPLIDLPDLPSSSPEQALILALMRQESEFYPQAVSHAGARGLMQLMPRTARQTARTVGEPYRRNWLTEDPAYNIRIGSAHLEELLEDFNGSYIMAAAAYNAGGSRVRRWINAYGDPRTGAIDPVDWVESIPFSETRNYVQRVLENTTVYRARLNGGTIKFDTDDDLMRGARRRAG